MSDMLDLFKGLIKKVEKPVVFELGAHMGEHTVQLIEAIGDRDFQFHAFEPVKEFIPHIEYLTEKYRDRVKIWNFAVGSKVEAGVDFWLSKGKYSGSSSIRAPKEALDIWKDMEFEKTTTDIISLDYVMKLENIDHVDFIWADIQGAEIDMIKGATEFLKRTKYLYTEYNNHELYEGTILFKELISLLPDFEQERIWEYDVLLRNSKYLQQ